MSTTPLYQPPPPPDTTSTQQAYTSSAAHGSVGPVIGVLAVITVLGVLAGMVGRMCSGKPVMGYGGHYDLEGWIETKCATCIDGRVEPPPRPHRPVVAVPIAGQFQEASGEIKEEGDVERADDQDNDGEDEDDTDDVEEHQEEEKVSHERKQH